MSRKNRAEKRDILPDAKYQDILVAKLINRIMWHGKKSLAEKVAYESFKIISDNFKDDPLKIFKQAIDKLKPNVEVVSRRVGGANYQVPVEVRSERKVTLALRWLVTYARQRSEKNMIERLAAEISDVFAERGASIKKRDDVHKMAEANKAFAHFRW